MFNELSVRYTPKHHSGFLSPAKNLPMSQYLFETEKVEDGRSGIPHILSNIEVCKSVGSFLSSTLGPYGQDKLFYGPKILVTNDGATILENMCYQHPVARLLLEVSKSQDSEVGDGTTSVVLLASEILSSLAPLIRERYPIKLLRDVLVSTRTFCIEHLDSLKIPFNEGTLTTLAETSLNSKCIRHEKSYFARMLVEGLKDNGELFIIKVPGGSLHDSTLVNGLAFEKTFTYAGYEQQPRRIENPRICCLNVELEWKSERENAEVRVDSVEEYQQMVNSEWKLIDEKLDDIIGLGSNVVLSSLPIGDYATQYFASKNVFSAGRVPHIERITTAFGGRTSGSTKHAVLGACDLFEERQLGGIRCNYFEGARCKARTLILRGPGAEALEEVERAVHDAVCIIRTAMKHKEIVAGGGAVEMELSKLCRSKAFEAGEEQFFILQAVSKAFEAIPLQLSKNFGHDPLLMIQKLRKAHASSIYAGVGSRDVINMLEANVLEPLEVKKSMLKAAFNIVDAVISINSTIISKR